MAVLFPRQSPIRETRDHGDSMLDVQAIGLIIIVFIKRS